MPEGVDPLEPFVEGAVEATVDVLRPLLNQVIAHQARLMASAMVAEADLVPRGALEGQMTAQELLRRVLQRLAEHAKRPGSTSTGAHRVVVTMARDLGVFGADSMPYLTRTRAQVEADRDHRWQLDRTGTEGPVATRSGAEGRQK